MPKICLFLISVFYFFNLISSPLYAEEESKKNMDDCRSEFMGQKLSAYDTCLSQAQVGADVSTGYPEAQKIIADMYYWGWGEKLQKNYDTAVMWYKRAAMKGNTGAKFALGVLYEQGKGVGANYNKAIKWFTSAAEDGHVGAQFNLANMYSKGAGTRQNHFMATKWYLRAANQGDGESAYNVANHYAKGEGIGSNLVESYKWYLIAEDLLGKLPEIDNSIQLITTQMKEAEVDQAKALAQQWQPKKEDPNLIY